VIELELSTNLIVALVAAVIILAVVVAIAYFSREAGLGALQQIWDIGSWIEELFKK
jgi:hypothetical protein